MTWSAHATVTEVTGSGPVNVTAVANAGETLNSAGTDYPALYSNTEGKIARLLVRFTIDADSVGIAVGDVIDLYGHFRG